MILEHTDVGRRLAACAASRCARRVASGLRLFEEGEEWSPGTEVMSIYMPNQPASPKAGIARLLTIEHRCPGLAEPER